MREEVYVKFAEALQRTRNSEAISRAYAAGFAKAAELARVDPQLLIKQALADPEVVTGAGMALRGLAGATAGGLGGYAVSDMTGGDKRTRMDKIKHAILGALAGGVLGAGSAVPQVGMAIQA